MICIANISDSIEHFRNISFRISMLIIIKYSSLLYIIYRYSSLLFVRQSLIALQNNFTTQINYNI